MNKDLSSWAARPLPQRVPLEGFYCRLEPLDPAHHGDSLFAESMAEGAETRHRYLFDKVEDRVGFDAWMKAKAALADPLFFAVIDRASGRACGRQALMRVDANHGVIEIGNILWGPSIARSRVATEALFLFARYAFDTLGYRRFEWKCDNANAPSKRAAERFGFTFEGVFRQHMVNKGRNRDTAWFAMLDGEWPALKAGYQAWLDPANFDAAGQQKRGLAECLTAARA
ncbi:MAG: GNAT family N-acetyltransferase [Proteobacteria bacterium]|nr:GNAT family N-acetyltransferase [Pseudomonadota bacterium]